jgi:hypothetical protein
VGADWRDDEAATAFGGVLITERSSGDEVGAGWRDDEAATAFRGVLIPELSSGIEVGADWRDDEAATAFRGVVIPERSSGDEVGARWRDEEAPTALGVVVNTDWRVEGDGLGDEADPGWWQASPHPRGGLADASAHRRGPLRPPGQRSCARREKPERHHPQISANLEREVARVVFGVPAGSSPSAVGE